MKKIVTKISLLFFIFLLFSCKKEQRKGIPSNDLIILNDLIKIEILIDSCSFEYYSKVENQSRGIPGPSDMALVAILYYSDSNYLTIKGMLEQSPIDISQYEFLEHYQIFDKRDIRNWLSFDIKKCLQSDTITFYQPIPYINDRLKSGKCLLCSNNRVFLFME